MWTSASSNDLINTGKPAGTRNAQPQMMHPACMKKLFEISSGMVTVHELTKLSCLRVQSKFMTMDWIAVFSNIRSASKLEFMLPETRLYFDKIYENKDVKERW